MAITIRRILEQVQNGTIRIPAFQRGFVWDAERVAYLMDSIYKGYPFGSLILWRTKEKLSYEKRLGPFELQDVEPEYPIDYVLDGQQRLTSIFGVFQTELGPIEDASWTRIYFDMSAHSDLQESQFVCLPENEVKPDRHFPIGTLFDVTAYRQATSSLSPEQANLIDQVQSVFKEATIPTQEVATEDRAKVAIVFERVNRMGVELDTFQLLSAWTWSEDFDLQERIRTLADEVSPHGFGDISEDTNLILRCCAAVVAEDASPAALMGLKGSEVRRRFDEIENGVRGAIDFLRSNLEVKTLANLPYSALLVPLSVFFATSGSSGLKLTHEQRSAIKRWFWKSCFSRRFSAGVLRNLKRDITEMQKLRKGKKSSLDTFVAAVDADYFMEQSFTIGTVHTKTLILLLANRRPLSFVSGSPIDLGPVLQAYNREEFHHLMPRSFLKGEGKSTAEINKLANFAIISADDNKTLGGVAPSVYKSRMPAAYLDNILDSAGCPHSLFDDDYAIFMAARSRVLAEYGTGLMTAY
ncbi:GmrSD restriction endonuclease domain-containing protein [Micromonospora profundi]